MKKQIMVLGSLLFTSLVFSCGTSTPDLTAEQRQSYLEKGDSIATAAQKILIGNLTTAIAEHDFAGAVDFCNLNAIPLTDSASNLYGAKIQRVTDKNRNPENHLKGDADENAWKTMKELMTNKNIEDKHLLMQLDNELYYYKAITIGMPTCLSCHGSKENDIQNATWTAIQNKYPKDQATGYQMNDLRGLWKIQLK